MFWKDNYIKYLITDYSIQPCNLTICSLSTWRGLEKPVGDVRSETEIQCSGRCNVLRENCTSFHYDHQTHLCTPAKVRLARLDKDERKINIHKYKIRKTNQSPWLPSYHHHPLQDPRALDTYNIRTYDLYLCHSVLL